MVAALRHHPRRWLAAACAVAVTACGPSTVASPRPPGSISSAPSSSPTSAPSSAGPLLSGALIVTGAYAETDTFTVRAEIETGGEPSAAPHDFTCADYARGTQDPRSNGATTFAAPVIDTSGKTAGALPVSFRATTDAGYAGPGTYLSSTLTSLNGSMIVDVGQFIDYFFSRFGTTSLRVEPDGGGRLSFTHWYSTGSTSSMSGTVVWTCR